MVKTYGPLASAKRLVTSELQEGLITLAELGRLDLSIESIMQEERFRPLFSPQELEAAKWRLDRVK